MGQPYALHLQIFVQELSAGSGRWCSIPSRVIRQKSLISQHWPNESACWREAPSHRMGLIWHVNTATHGGGRGVDHRPCEQATGAAVNWQRTLLWAKQDVFPSPPGKTSWLVESVLCLLDSCSHYFFLHSVNVWHFAWLVVQSLLVTFYLYKKKLFTQVCQLLSTCKFTFVLLVNTWTYPFFFVLDVMRNSDCSTDSNATCFCFIFIWIFFYFTLVYLCIFIYVFNFMSFLCYICYKKTLCLVNHRKSIK